MPRLGPYDLTGSIASGATAEVLAARRGDEVLALKCLHPHLARAEESLLRFRREGDLLAAVECPGVPRLYDRGVHEGQPFLAMTCVRGRTLAELHPATVGSPWPVDVAADFVARAARVLAGVHASADARGPLKIVHGDVAPSNLLLDDEGQVWLVDFGVARSGRDDPFDPTPRGTHAYMAPEVVLGRGADPRADVFALGILLFELVTGTRLFFDPAGATIVRVVELPIPSMRDLRADCPSSLDEFAGRALARDPDARIASAAAFVRELEGIVLEQGWRSERDVDTRGRAW